MASMTETRAMKKALKLAIHGRGSTFPNPMVGAVILDRDGNHAGEGFHRKCGAPHAEVIAIASAGDAASGGHHGCNPGAMLSSWPYRAMHR